MVFSNPFSVKLTNAHEAASDRHPQLQHFTIFNPDNVYRPDPEQVLELAQALGLDGKSGFGKIVSYKPERQALHWTMAYLNLYAKVANDAEFEGLVKTFFADNVQPNITLQKLSH